MSARIVSFGRTLCAALLLVFSWAPMDARADQSATGSITGVVADANGSLPVGGATLSLESGTTVIATTTTNSAGNFTFSHVAPGTYTIVFSATGYESARSDLIEVGSGQQTVGIVVHRGELKTLGHVTATSKAASLQTTTTIQHNVDTEVMQKTNQVRLAEGLGKLPQVNYIGQDSAVGDDIAIDIRGLKPSETQVMLDGHPVGPLGVFPGSIGGGQGGFDFQDAPLFAIANSVVTYGSGAVGLYGVDAVGGSVDLQTLNPTLTPQSTLQYGFGDQGKQQLALQMTGTEGKVGYALLHGVLGTYGDFPTQNITQSGLLGTDFTSATRQLDTYPVSADYILRNDLAKFRMDFNPKTSLSFTAYSANSWDDKTGNGDNDFLTYNYQLLQAQGASNCTAGSQPGIMVTTDAGSQCVTLQQYAAGSSGPLGGGPGAFQALRNQDYHARLLTKIGKSQLAIDGFTDNYTQDRQRSASAQNGPLNVLTRAYRSFGMLVSDDIATDTNDIGVGLYSQRQYINGDALSGGTFVVATPTRLKVDSFFLRDAFTPSDQIQYFANLWVKHSLVGGNSVDPRLSVVFKPTAANVFRITGGASSADPAPIALDLTGAGGINPGNCQTWGIGNAPSPGELPEKASDFEVSVAHRWVEDTISQLTAYDTNETNTIFEDQLPASGFLDQIATYGPQYLPGVFQHIQQICPGSNPTIADLTVSTNVNLAKSRARGLELSQRYRASSHAVFDGYYDVQSTTIFDAPAFLLQENPTLIPGSQLPEIPLHKYGLDADLSTTHGGELFLDYTWYDGNNPLHRPAYGVADASINQQITQHVGVNLGIANLFNSNVDDYGRIGWGVFVPENQFGPDTNGLNQGSERFGLSPRTLGLTITIKE